MDISVVVPTYNRRDIVARSLETLFAQDFPPWRFDIIVVVDGSTDGTAVALREMRPPCAFRVIEQENRGPAGARNTGFRAAQSDLVLFLDDDMRCDPGLLLAHAKAHQRFGTGVVFGALFLAADSKANLASECFKREIGAFHLQYRTAPQSKFEVGSITFSNASLPREMLAAEGGFDESFRMREDLELAIRLRENGVRLDYAPDAIARQYYEKTATDLLADAERFAIADVNLAKKHPGQLIEGHVRWLVKERGWKTTLRNAVARFPVLEKTLLAPGCALGERFFAFGPLRSVGVRALQMRRRIHWLRVVKRLTHS
ncbi:MAG TPA: glycosyltransferase family 2 protein [Terracidiphilus sp.]|jgi:GT2 family glycosyltransferase